MVQQSRLAEQRQGSTGQHSGAAFPGDPLGDFGQYYFVALSVVATDQADELKSCRTEAKEQVFPSASHHFGPKRDRLRMR